MVMLVICFGQFFESVRISAVLDLRTINGKKDDLPTGVDSPPKAAFICHAF
jgi:hypothetical protein